MHSGTEAMPCDGLNTIFFCFISFAIRVALFVVNDFDLLRYVRMAHILKRLVFSLGETNGINIAFLLNDVGLWRRFDALIRDKRMHILDFSEYSGTLFVLSWTINGRQLFLIGKNEIIIRMQTKCGKRPILTP